VAAATAAGALGIDPDVTARGLAAAGPVAGRFELVEGGQPFPVIVDYAHTPDGLEQLLLAAREVAPRRVILVFGAGGDRDRAKRPAMGDAASRLADHIVLTSDNPRNEEPRAIIESVRSGMAGDATLVIEPDRREAIVRGLTVAEAGDVVVVAGKGHETTQTFADRTIDFDDRVVILEELARLAGGERR
jgi:UDP-N-acetylmuramoyl-L-alanyl-D-glutamate--2,6-diaminopimelate ligase